MNGLAERLVKWADKQKAWQRDLLRRLAEGEIVESSTLETYAYLAIEEQYNKCKDWITTPNLAPEVDLKPLQLSHLTRTDSGSEPVRLQKIEHIAGANRLAPGANLEFASQGLNIIAGSNGSGKSGYTRILKQVAASRAPGSVLPNVYEVDCDPSAVINFEVGKLGSKAFTWNSGSEDSQDELRRIRVFDALSAQTHLEKSSEVAYVPPALQILSEYVGALNEVSTMVGNLAERRRGQEPDLSELTEGSGIKIVEALGDKTAISILESVKELTPEEQKRSEELPSLISNLVQNDPAKLAAQAADRSRNLERLRKQIERLSTSLNAQTVAKIVTLVTEKTTALTQVEVAANLLKNDSTMAPGTGNTTWRRLWQAARDHVASASDQHDAPSPPGSCPLCQQDLNEDAQERFKKFENFINNEAQLALKHAEINLESAITTLRNLTIPEFDDHTELVTSFSKELASRIGLILGKYLELRDSVVALGERLETDPATPSTKIQAAWEELTTEADSVSQELEEFSKKESAEAEKLRNSDSSAAAVIRLKDELSELIVRAKLFSLVDKLRIEHDRRIQIAALEKAQRDCSTAKATKLNKTLSSEYVAKVCEQFRAEADGLGIDRVPVALKFDRASRGVNYIKVALEDAPNHSVTEVLSEGEQRMAAIAGFFADLTESGDHSLLIFDDPVSSLDQVFRRQVARRLVQESSRRQVLVFTHDVSFVRELYEEHERQTKKRNVDSKPKLPELHYLHINRTRDGTGVTTEAEHWYQVAFKSKIGAIRQRIARSRPIYRAHDDHLYLQEAKDISGSIRECWEVLVEQELLAGVVTRFKRSIETQRLKDLIPVAQQDLDRIDNGMSIHSRLFRGHAAPEDDKSSPPTPDELDKEIQELATFRDEIEARRKAQGKERKNAKSSLN